MKSGSGYELLGLISQIGLGIVFTVGAAGYGGHYVDRRLGTGAVFTVIGLLLGVGGAYWSVYTTVESFFQRKGGGSSRE